MKHKIYSKTKLDKQELSSRNKRMTSESAQKIMSFAIAEQEEIILINELKALYNSIRSTISMTVTHTELIEGEEINYVLERIHLFEQQIKKLVKLNKKIISTLSNGLKEFKQNISKTQVHLAIKLFQDTVVIPLEKQMAETHKSSDGKNWIRTSFVILRN